MLFSKKRQEDLEAYRDITDDVEESDFVPYSCLYNDHTVLTKNGELMQTIAVSGPFLRNLEQPESVSSLRSAIREAIKKYIISDCYAVWIHTVRRETNYSLPVVPTHPFSQRTHTAWEDQNQFAKQFTNEVFISIVREGHDADIIGIKDFIRGLIPSRDVQWHNQHLDALYTELNVVVDNVTQHLKNFGSRKLGIYEENGIYYSDSCAFLEKIINLVDRKMPVTDVDLAHYLTTSEITFSFNAMEVRRSDGRRRFASLLTLKEYKEKSLPAIDTFLKAPIEYIVTQCVDFINPEKALAQYKKQKTITDQSGADELAEMTEINLILNSDHGNPCDFGQQQLSIFLLADSVRQLETYTRKAMSFMAKSGIMAIREDIHFEETYWAQLPGNFEFIRRLIPTNTSHIAGFTNLLRYPTGKSNDNHWGHALTTLYTHAGTPYFFNFHYGDNGHTLIAGSSHSRRRELILFFLSLAQKYQPQIHMLAVHKDLERIAETLDGKTLHYNTQLDGTALHHFNPFWLKHTPENIQFLSQWLMMFASFNGTQADDHLRNTIQKAFQTLAVEWQHMTMQHIASQIIAIEPSYQAVFTKLLPHGEFGALFNGANTAAPSSGLIIHELSKVTSHNTIFTPYLSLILHYITENLDGNRTILVLDDGLEWLRYTTIGNGAESWLQALARRNTMCIFLSNGGSFHTNNPYTASLQAHFATRIFLSNPQGLDNYPASFMLTELDQEYIDSLDANRLQFLIKNPMETVVSGVDITSKCSFIRNVFKEKQVNSDPLLGGVQWSAESLTITSAGR